MDKINYETRDEEPNKKEYLEMDDILFDDLVKKCGFPSNTNCIDFSFTKDFAYTIRVIRKGAQGYDN